MSAKMFDAAVVGAGVFGAWTALRLRRTGHTVALIDAYGAGNSRASSGGETRVIRAGYGAQDFYTLWAARSLKLWQEFFSQQSCKGLYARTGVLWLAREGDALVTETLATLERHGLPAEHLTRDELERRYTQFDFGEISWGVIEPEAGVLLARRAVQKVVEAFVAEGGEYVHASVVEPSGKGKLSAIATRDVEKISAGAYIFACGPWLPKLFPKILGGRINPSRQDVFFFGTPPGDARFAVPLMPVWIDFGAEVYGIPDIENRGFKIALDRHGPTFDPDTDSRLPGAETLDEVRRYLSLRFPLMADAPLVETRVCQYENTSNGDFLIDRHPAFENVWLVGGGSGHGFKHGPALGEYVASLVVDGGEPKSRFRLATKELARHRAIY